MVLSSFTNAMTLSEPYREKEPWKAGDVGPGPALLSVLCGLVPVDGS